MNVSLGSQPHTSSPGYANGRVLGAAAAPRRPFMQVTAGASPLVFESHLMSEGSVLRVPVPVSQSASSPTMILGAVEMVR